MFQATSASIDTSKHLRTVRTVRLEDLANSIASQGFRPCSWLGRFSFHTV